MAQITNGMLATLLPRAIWIKSSHSNPVGECVELANPTKREIAVRNSRHPDGPVLILTRKPSSPQIAIPRRQSCTQPQEVATAQAKHLAVYPRMRCSVDAPCPRQSLNTRIAEPI